MDPILDKKNPSLKKYFKYMVNSRKLTIKFTPSKIRQIIISDLQIEFLSFSEIVREVCIEMFTFYIQTWPGWQPERFQQCMDHPENTYTDFKLYLKDKILKLNEKQHLYNVPDATTKKADNNMGFQLNPPPDSYQQLPVDSSKRKIKFPYTLEITANPRVFNTLYFQSLNGRTTVSINEQPVHPRLLSTIEALNSPYVAVLFKVPGLIKFSRKNVHRMEMFLCRSSDNWQFPIQDHIVDIRKYPARNGVYTSAFLKMLFSNIISVVDRHAQKVR